MMLDGMPPLKLTLSHPFAVNHIFFGKGSELHAVETQYSSHSSSLDRQPSGFCPIILVLEFPDLSTLTVWNNLPQAHSDIRISHAYWPLLLVTAQLALVLQLQRKNARLLSQSGDIEATASIRAVHCTVYYNSMYMAPEVKCTA